MLKEGRGEEIRVLREREAGIDVVAVPETGELTVQAAAEAGIGVKLKTSVEALLEIGTNIKVRVKTKKGRRSRVEL